MKVYQYESYDDYKQAQTEANLRKIDKIWTQKNTILKIKSFVSEASNIICHGTRNGAEQKYFKTEYPSAYVIGTEISSTAWQFDYTIQWDFAEQKPEWVNKFDIVYSNSFDHSFDPNKTIKTRKEQVAENGRIFLEWSLTDFSSKRSDPTGGSPEELVSFLAENEIVIEDSFKSVGWGGGRALVYCCRANS